MPFLVRKLNKRGQFSTLIEKDCVEDILADVPTNEFRSNKGTLSTWFIERLEDIDNAVLAIALTSTDISRMDFIVIDTSLLDQHGLEYKQTYAGREIPVADLQNTHYDIVGITLKKLRDCTDVYKTIYVKEADGENKFIKRYNVSQIKEILKQAIADKRIDASKANDSISEVIEKLSAELK